MSFLKTVEPANQKRFQIKYNRMKNLLRVSRCPGVWRIGRHVFLHPPVGKTEKAPFHASFPEPVTGKQGSASLEAALAVPIFLFFFGNLLALLLAFGTYGRNLAQLHQAGKAMAAASWGTDGGGDIIRLNRSFVIKPYFPLARFPKSIAMNGCYLHKWNGYDLSRADGGAEAENGTTVYVAENAAVYHKDAGCSHLQLSVQAVSREEAEKARNLYGARYRPCERCGKTTELNNGTVYLAQEGKRYHSSFSCSGLKRTVYTVPLSQTGSLPPCSRCSR